MAREEKLQLLLSIQQKKFLFMEMTHIFIDTFSQNMKKPVLLHFNHSTEQVRKMIGGKVAIDFGFIERK